MLVDIVEKSFGTVQNIGALVDMADEDVVAVDVVDVVAVDVVAVDVVAVDVVVAAVVFVHKEDDVDKMISNS